jgi:hypothetical protein
MWWATPLKMRQMSPLGMPPVVPLVVVLLMPLLLPVSQAPMVVVVLLLMLMLMSLLESLLLLLVSLLLLVLLLTSQYVMCGWGCAPFNILTTALAPSVCNNLRSASPPPSSPLPPLNCPFCPRRIEGTSRRRIGDGCRHHACTIGDQPHAARD